MTFLNGESSIQVEAKNADGTAGAVNNRYFAKFLAASILALSSLGANAQEPDLLQGIESDEYITELNEIRAISQSDDAKQALLEKMKAYGQAPVDNAAEQEMLRHSLSPRMKAGIKDISVVESRISEKSKYPHLRPEFHENSITCNISMFNMDGLYKEKYEFQPDRNAGHDAMFREFAVLHEGSHCGEYAQDQSKKSISMKQVLDAMKITGMEQGDIAIRKNDLRMHFSEIQADTFAYLTLVKRHFIDAPNDESRLLGQQRLIDLGDDLKTLRVRDPDRKNKFTTHGHHQTWEVLSRLIDHIETEMNKPNGLESLGKKIKSADSIDNISTHLAAGYIFANFSNINKDLVHMYIVQRTDTANNLEIHLSGGKAQFPSEETKTKSVDDLQKILENEIRIIEYYVQKQDQEIDIKNSFAPKHKDFVIQSAQEWNRIKNNFTDYGLGTNINTSFYKQIAMPQSSIDLGMKP